MKEHNRAPRERLVPLLLDEAGDADAPGRSPARQGGRRAALRPDQRAAQDVSRREKAAYWVAPFKYSMRFLRSSSLGRPGKVILLPGTKSFGFVR